MTPSDPVDLPRRPGQDPTPLLDADRAAVLQNYARPPIVFIRGEGAWLYDDAGRRYLDFNAGIAVSALGHGDAELAHAIADQAGRLIHTSNLYHTPPYIRLAEQLVARSFADRVYFGNSGAEVVEAALKFARLYARKTHGEMPAPDGWSELVDDAATSSWPRKWRTVAFDHAFHGRTMGALSLTHKAAYRAPFAPLLPGVVFAPFNDVAAAEAAIDETTMAVVVEPIQGEGGYVPATLPFLHALRTRCDAVGALLVLDEIQCGLGRTGHLFAHEMYGVRPDIVCLAKPLAGGLPIGAVLMTQAVADCVGVGEHGSTFAGGPLVCRAAEVVLNRVSDPAFLAAVQARSDHLVRGLLALDSPHIVDIRGAGLMIGVELDLAVKPIVDAARDDGVLLIGAGERVLRLCPPLIVDEAQIDLAVGAIGRAIAHTAERSAAPG
ncbi:MAG: aminotransferase class III-fold pyridoxal phosphate-dependent enzyme [Ardenticatenales bacterium]|nr:aminotransferase class III-fold pyridoxal phosphate-dependent enzyme [Ardenticatenales bacterium]